MSGSIWPLILAALFALPFAYAELVWTPLSSWGCIQRQTRGFLGPVQHRWRMVTCSGFTSSWFDGSPRDIFFQAGLAQAMRDLEAWHQRQDAGEMRGVESGRKG